MTAKWLSDFRGRFESACTDDAPRVCGVPAACVFAPHAAAEAAAAIRFAAVHGVPVVPLGNGSQQETLRPPPPEFLALSTRKMNALVHHEPGDMVATIQAGADVDAVQARLRERGQWLPIDGSGSTIGGMVAANTHGPRALGYGTLRDMVLGMTVINGDGVLRTCGAKVVKNVTGYSLEKLYIGSQGTLGLIVEVTFKLRPLPVGLRQWRGSFSTLRDAVAALRAISAKTLPLEAACATREHGATAEMRVRAAGTEAELARIDAEVRASVPALASEAAQEDPLARVGAPPAPGARLRIGCVPSKLDAVLEILPHADAPCSLSLNGGTVDLSPLTGAEAERIAGALEKIGVHFSWEYVAGLTLDARWGAPRREWALMRQLKRALDPQGILNPGRYVC
jgi:glycolate oxidase FAD binding subunit